MRRRLTALLDTCVAVLHSLRILQYRRPRTSLFGSHVSSGDQREIAERIWCNLLHNAGGPDCDRVIHLALQHLKDDLHSERGHEVLEDIRREVAYRSWCDEIARLRTHESRRHTNQDNQPCKIQATEL
jgi:hypothetical protein